MRKILKSSANPGRWAAMILALVVGIPAATRADEPVRLDTILYGASYYLEYMPVERLDKDVDLMAKAGLTFIRVGESSWGVLEPEDGRFDFDWLGRVLDRLHAAGIKVILGTPTYSIPAWLYKAHPEIQVRQINRPRYTYGLRQMSDVTHPIYRRYAERIIRRLVGRFRDHPAVIGYQLDNEMHPSGTADAHVQAAFRDHVKTKFGTPEALNRAWGLNYWGQRLNTFDELPPRDGILNPGYKLEWERFQQQIAADFLAWQAAIVRELRRPGQFVTHDFVGGLPGDVDQTEIAKCLDVVSTNVYFATQNDFSGEEIAFSGDLNRSLKRRNYFVTETNAQTTGWDSAGQFPPYDGQLRLAALAHVTSGADLVAYWHWHSLHYGQETYWKGVLGHDLEPGRVYAEVRRIAGDLKRVGPELAGLAKRNRVAILFSLDSWNALRDMPFDRSVDYLTVLQGMYRALYRLNVETDFAFPSSRSFDDYDLLLVPPLYIADDALLERLSKYVENGGHLLLAFKSGFCDGNATVRLTTAPGPLRTACGFSYGEFTNLKAPLGLKGGPFGAGEAAAASVWAEYLIPEKALSLAHYDHPVLGAFPAVTRNAFGRGSVTYEGTHLSDRARDILLRDVLKAAGIPMTDAGLPPGVKAKHGRLRSGAAFHAFFNFSGEPRAFEYAYGPGRDLLQEVSVAPGRKLVLPPWDAAIIKEAR